MELEGGNRCFLFIVARCTPGDPHAGSFILACVRGLRGLEAAMSQFAFAGLVYFSSRDNVVEIAGMSTAEAIIHSREESIHLERRLFFRFTKKTRGVDCRVIFVLIALVKLAPLFIMDVDSTILGLLKIMVMKH